MEPLNQELPPQTPPTNKLAPMILAIVLSAVLSGSTVGLVVYYFVNSSNQVKTDAMLSQIEGMGKAYKSLQEELAAKQQPDQVVEEKTNSDVVISKGVLIARPNLKQTPPASNPGNLVQEYSIILLDPKTGKEKELGIIKNNFFVNSFGYYDDKVLYISPKGTIHSFDVKSSTDEELAIEGITPAEVIPDKIKFNMVSDFIISDSTIFYLKGICQEGDYCALGKFDLASKTNKVLYDNLHYKLPDKIYSVIRLRSYDKVSNKLQITDSWGDGGFANSEIYELNLGTKALVKIGGYRYESCAGEICPEAVEKENEQYSKNTMKPLVNCLDSTLKLTNNSVNISGLNKTLDSSYYIGCMSK